MSKTLLLALMTAWLTLNSWVGASNPLYVCDYFIYWIVPQYVKTTQDRHVYGVNAEMKTWSFAQTPSSVIDSKFANATATQLKECVHLQTPFMYAVLGGVSAGNYDKDKLLFSRICFVALLLSSVLLLVMIGFEVELALLLWIFIVFFYAPVGWDGAALNTNRILLGVLTGAAALLWSPVKQRHFGAGFLLGIGVLLKPTTVLIPFFLTLSRILRRQWSILLQEGAGIFAGALVGTVIGSFFWGRFGVWLDWASRIMNYQTSQAPLAEKNFSLPAILNELVHVELSSAVFYVGLMAATGRMIQFTRRYVKKEGSKAQLDDFGFDLSIIVSGLLVYLLIAKLVWIHYYVIAIPAILLQFSQQWPPSRIRIIVLGIGVSVFIGFPLEFLNQTFNFSSPLLTGLLYWISALSFFLLGTSQPFTRNTRNKRTAI